MIDFLSSNKLEESLYLYASISYVRKELQSGLSTNFNSENRFSIFENFDLIHFWHLFATEQIFAFADLLFSSCYVFTYIP